MLSTWYDMCVCMYIYNTYNIYTIYNIYVRHIYNMLLQSSFTIFVLVFRSSFESEIPGIHI